MVSPFTAFLLCQRVGKPRLQHLLANVQAKILGNYGAARESAYFKVWWRCATCFCGQAGPMLCKDN